MLERCVGGLSLLALAASLLLGGRAAAGEIFGPGEQSTYQVAYLGLPAGTAQVTVGAGMQQWGRQVLPIVTTARSDLPLYPIRDLFISYWDAGQRRSIGSDFYADENRKRRRQQIQFDHENKSALVRKQREGAEPTESTQEIQPGTSDLAAAAFILRGQPFNIGDEYELPIFTGSRQFVLRAKVEGKQHLTTPLGAKEVFRVRAKTDFAGKLAAKRDLLVYFTADETHVPVRVEAELVLGSVVAELIGYRPGAQLVAR